MMQARFYTFEVPVFWACMTSVITFIQEYYFFEVAFTLCWPHPSRCHLYVP